MTTMLKRPRDKIQFVYTTVYKLDNLDFLFIYILKAPQATIEILADPRLGTGLNTSNQLSGACERMLTILSKLYYL